MCRRSLNGSNAAMGSGSFALANEPLYIMPDGMQVAGSNPWFCRKKMMRFGPPDSLEAAKPAARLIPGNIVAPNATPNPAARVWSDSRRVIMVGVDYQRW